MECLGDDQGLPLWPALVGRNARRLDHAGLPLPVRLPVGDLRSVSSRSDVVLWFGSDAKLPLSSLAVSLPALMVLSLMVSSRALAASAHPPLVTLLPVDTSLLPADAAFIPK